MPAPPDPRPDDAAGAAGESGDRPRSRRRRRRRSWARRKHLGLITVGVALLVLVVGVVLVVATWDSGRVPVSRQAAALATAPTAATTPAATTAPATSGSPTASSAPGAVALRATITEIGDSRWTVQSATGLTYTVVVTPTTTLPRNRDFGSIVVGDVIAVKGTVDAGVITATSVAVAR